MSVDHIAFLVEERSMEDALQLLVPKVLGARTFEIHTHRGKPDLLARLPGRLLGYSSWIPKTWRIVVVVDRDNDECTELKARLERMATDAGLLTRSTATTMPFVVVNRIAVEELEAWYFGDWKAVCAAYPKVASTVPAKAGTRDPDAITGGTWEVFERVLQDAGYFKTGLRKIEAARAVAAHMDPGRNTSKSFQVFRDALNGTSARRRGQHQVEM